MNEHLTDRGIAFEGGKMCFDADAFGEIFCSPFPSFF
jgi:hypothetical protein